MAMDADLIAARSAWPRPADVSRAMQNVDGIQWSPEQLAFQEWLSTPAKERVPSLQSEYAQLHCIGETTLWRWKLQAGFSDAVFALSKRLLKSDKLAAVLNAQADLAISGLPFASTQAAQLVLTAAGEMPKAGGDINVDARTLIVREFPASDMPD